MGRECGCGSDDCEGECAPARPYEQADLRDQDVQTLLDDPLVVEWLDAAEALLAQQDAPDGEPDPVGSALWLDLMLAERAGFAAGEERELLPGLSVRCLASRGDGDRYLVRLFGPGRAYGIDVAVFAMCQAARHHRLLDLVHALFAGRDRALVETAIARYRQACDLAARSADQRRAERAATRP